jgi:hypothetical protein
MHYTMNTLPKQLTAVHCSLLVMYTDERFVPDQSLSSRFNPTFAGAGITTFASGFHIGGHAGYYADGISELCH